jgi:hypothetical protein
LTVHGKSPAELERSNRLFAVESAVKLGYVAEGPNVMTTAREIFEFMQESPAIPETQTGFATQ